MSASLDIRASEQLASLTAPQTLGLVGAELYGFINSCATTDQLQAMAALVWEHYGNNRLSDSEASYLGSCIDRRRGVSRQAVPTAVAPLRGRVNKFFPRKPQRSPDREASRGRRRTLGGSSVLPPDLRSLFTEGEARGSLRHRKRGQASWLVRLAKR